MVPNIIVYVTYLYYLESWMIFYFLFFLFQLLPNNVGRVGKLLLDSELVSSPIFIDVI